MTQKLKAVKRALKNTTEHQTEMYTSMMSLLGILRTHSSETKHVALSRAVTAVSASVATSVLIKSALAFRRSYKESDAFYVKIREDDRLFQIAENWLMEIMPEEDKISLYTRTTTTIGEDHPSDGPADPGGSQKLSVNIHTTFDGSVVQEVTLDKHKIRIEASSPDVRRKSASTKELVSQREFRFMCSSLEAREAVLTELRHRAKSLADEGNQLYVCRSWGNFARRIAPTRDVNSVILKSNQMERICNHVDEFLASEGAYAKTGLPYHTGILLYGPPGTGKSSTGTVIGTKFGLDIYYISLLIMDSDEALQDAFSVVPPRSIVIVEDIDITSATSSRDPEGPRGVTMQGLLNVLDGQLAPHGVITFMTTNNVDSLDDAIIRPGRVDLMEEIGNLDNEQLRGICEYFMGSVPTGLPKISVNDNISSASVIGILRNYIPNFSEASTELVKFVKESKKKKELV